MLRLNEEGKLASDEKWWTLRETGLQKTKNENANYSHLGKLGSSLSKTCRKKKVWFFGHEWVCVFDDRNVNNHSEDKEEQLRE